jgi:hypothetical protein
MYLAAGVHLSEAPVYALQTTRTPTPSPCYTLYEYISLYLFTQGRGGGGRIGGTVRRLEGRYFTRVVENTHMTDCISSL